MERIKDFGDPTVKRKQIASFKKQLSIGNNAEYEKWNFSYKFKNIYPSSVLIHVVCQKWLIFEKRSFGVLTLHVHPEKHVKKIQLAMVPSQENRGKPQVFCG